MSRKDLLFFFSVTNIFRGYFPIKHLVFYIYKTFISMKWVLISLSNLNCYQVIQNCDELFCREELSAVPDIGWPDCFNSGVFVYSPSVHTFWQLLEFAEKQGSYDGTFCCYSYIFDLVNIIRTFLNPHTIVEVSFT